MGEVKKRNRRYGHLNAPADVMHQSSFFEQIVRREVRRAIKSSKSSTSRRHTKAA